MSNSHTSDGGLGHGWPGGGSKSGAGPSSVSPSHMRTPQGALWTSRASLRGNVTEWLSNLTCSKCHWTESFFLMESVFGYIPKRLTVSRSTPGHASHKRVPSRRNTDVRLAEKVR